MTKPNKRVILMSLKQTKSKTITRMGMHSPQELEGSVGLFHDLATIKTHKKYRKEMKDYIRGNLSQWLTNLNFNDIRTEHLDIALVIRVSKRNMRFQDVDNIAKVFLDALKKDDDDSRFLFYDDHQITRLLIYKLESDKGDDGVTDCVTISFRVHDPDKQMTIINPISYI